MNFVDVQPKSFLDYAWTTPSSSVVAAPKPSKTSRKQNRCCDQCRKGKRACDAAILEDTLLETSRTGTSPTVFHYSDVYGPLASCSNCEKTKKVCTFEWLRSQRVLQASQPQMTSAPSPKRRRTGSNCPTKARKVDGSYPSSVSGKSTEPENTKREESLFNTTPPELGVTFGDFPCGTSMFAVDHTTNIFDERVPKVEIEDDEAFIDQLGALSEEGCALLGYDSGKGSSLGTLSDISDKPDDSPKAEHEVNSVAESNPTNTTGSMVRVNQKKRRRSSSATPSYGALPCPAMSYGGNLLLSSANAYLSESLLRVYHDSFENALACWVTERTCPYSARSNDLLSTNARPDWKSIYHRVIRLDRLAMAIRGRRLTQTEDQVASKALDLAILSFASQWAQSGQKTRTQYPFHSTATNGDSGVFSGQGDDNRPIGLEFDRTLQITAWQNARNALQKAGEIESFRVVLAQMIFALTQRPTDTNMTIMEDVRTAITPEAMVSTDSTEDIQYSPTAAIDTDMDECTDLMSRLDLAIEADGPPLHLESGLRLIHSLRSRMAVCRQRRSKPEPVDRGQQRRAPAMRFEEADRATVDLLFWLGVTFDTLSAAMHKRPLVVSDEDSDVVLKESMQTCGSPQAETPSASEAVTSGLWDGYLFTRQQDSKPAPTRWPCSFDQAATALCDAAPVKVLLFRRVCRIQTLLTRNARGMRVEDAVHAALDVYNHWDALYAPFVRDCIQHHSNLPPRVQSWYICVAGHWYLATLLLADLLEVVDESELGLKDATEHRNSIGFIARFRWNNCRVLSDLARCACPHNATSLSQSYGLNFTTSEGALLTDPWTAVLIRAFAKAGVLLLESETLLPAETDQEDAFRRADDCIKALWFLGKKSDMALSAARILGDALKQRRKSAQDRISDMTAFLASQEWHELEGLNAAIDVDCEL